MDAPTRKQLARWRARIGAGEARTVLSQLQELAKTSPEAGVLQLLGECYLAQGRLQEAMVPLAAATGLSDHAEPASLLASTLMRLDREDEARLIAQRILHRDPRNRAALSIMQQLPRA